MYYLQKKQLTAKDLLDFLLKHSNDIDLSKVHLISWDSQDYNDIYLGTRYHDKDFILHFDINFDLD